MSKQIAISSWDSALQCHSEYSFSSILASLINPVSSKASSNPPQKHSDEGNPAKIRIETENISYLSAQYVWNYKFDLIALVQQWI